MMGNNVSKTFSVDQKMFEKFEQICDTKRINKSKVIQDAIKDFIGENYDINKDIFYKLKYFEGSDLVKVVNKEKDFIILSNGNKMNIFDFEMMYEEEDLGVKQALRFLNSDKGVDDVEQVDPDFLNNSFMNEESIKNIVDQVDIKHVLINETKKIRENDKVFDEELTATEDFFKPVLNGDKIKEFFDNIDTKNIINVDPNDNVKYSVIQDPTNIEGKINEWKPEEFEEISLSEKKTIVSKIKGYENEIYTKLTTDRLSEILTDIFNTNVEIEELTLFSEKQQKEVKMQLIRIPRKYHKYSELENILSRNFDRYEYRNIEETPINEKIKDRISKINASDFVNMSSKPTHMSDMLNKILTGIAPFGTEVTVTFDEPLYTISIPRKYICAEIMQFIYSYGVNPEYIIIENSDAKL